MSTQEQTGDQVGRATDGTAVRWGGAASVRLRRVGMADEAAVRALVSDLGYAPPERLSALLRAVLRRPDMVLFLAVDRLDTPLGLLQLSCRPQVHLGGALVSIDALVVAAGARGQGIGARLLRRARAYARLHRAVRVEVHTSRARANYQRGFYPAHGYHEAESALFRLVELEARGLGPILPASTITVEGMIHDRGTGTPEDLP